MEPTGPLHRKPPRSDHPDQEKHQEDEAKTQLIESLGLKKGAASEVLLKTVQQTLKNNEDLKEPFMQLISDYGDANLPEFSKKTEEFFTDGEFVVQKPEDLDTLRNITDQLIAKKILDEINQANTDEPIRNESVQNFYDHLIDNDELREAAIYFISYCLDNPKAAPLEIQEERIRFNQTIEHIGLKDQDNIKEVADLFEFHPSRILPKFVEKLSPAGFYSKEQLKSLSTEEWNEKFDADQDRIFGCKYFPAIPPNDFTEMIMEQEGYFKVSNEKGYWKKERINDDIVRIGHYFPNRSCIETEIIIPKSCEKEVIEILQGKRELGSDLSMGLVQELKNKLFALSRDAFRGNRVEGPYEDVTKDATNKIKKSIEERIHAIDDSINVRLEVRVESILTHLNLNENLFRLMNLCDQAIRTNRWAVDQHIDHLEELKQNIKLKEFIAQLKKDESMNFFYNLIDQLYNASYLKFEEEIEKKLSEAYHIETLFPEPKEPIQEKELSKPVTPLVVETTALLGAHPLPKGSDDVIDLYSKAGITLEFKKNISSFSDFFSSLLSFIKTNVDHLTQGQWKKYKSKELAERFEALKTIPEKFIEVEGRLTSAQKKGFEQLYRVLKDAAGLINRNVFHQILVPKEGKPLSRKKYESLSLQEKVLYDSQFRPDEKDGIWKRFTLEEDQIYIDYALPKTRSGFVFVDEEGRKSEQELVVKRVAVDLDLKFSGLDRESALEFLAKYCGQDPKTKTELKQDSTYTASELSSLGRTAKILEDQAWKKVFSLNHSLQDPKGDFETEDLSNEFAIPIYEKFLEDCREKLKFPFPDIPILRNAIEQQPLFSYSLDHMLSKMIEIRNAQLKGDTSYDVGKGLAELSGIWLDFYAGYPEYTNNDLNSFLGNELFLQFVGMANTQNLTDNFLFSYFAPDRLIQSETIITGASKALRHINMPEMRRPIEKTLSPFEKALHFRNYKKIILTPYSQLWQYHNWVMEEGEYYEDGRKLFKKGYCTIGFAMPAIEQVLEVDIPIDLSNIEFDTWEQNRDALIFIRSYLDEKPSEKMRPIEERRAEYQNDSPFPPGDKRTDILLEIAEQIEQDTNRLYNLPMLYLGQKALPREVRDVSVFVKEQAEIFEPIDQLTKECFPKDFLNLYGKFIYAAYEKEGFLDFYTPLLEKYKADFFMEKEEIDQLISFLDLGHEERTFRAELENLQAPSLKEKEVFTEDFITRYSPVLHAALQREGFRDLYDKILDWFIEGEPIKAERELNKIVQHLDLTEAEKEEFKEAFNAEIERYLS